MSEQYELSTIKDIFNKVPTDRIEECCREIAVILRQSAAVRDMIIAAAEATGIDIGDQEVVQLPDVITWVDDGLGVIDASFSCKGETLLNVKTELKK